MNVSVRGSMIVVVAAMVCPRPAAAQNGEVCAIDLAKVPFKPVKFDGIVIQAVPPDRVKVITARVEKETGAHINPKYAELPRISVRFVSRHRSFETIAAVVDGRIPKPGDHVDLLSRYRDPDARCSFIPVTVSAPALLS